MTATPTQRSMEELAGPQHTNPALDVALAYFEAWTSKNLDEAMSYVSEDIVCDAPRGDDFAAPRSIGHSWSPSRRSS